MSAVPLPAPLAEMHAAIDALHAYHPIPNFDVYVSKRDQVCSHLPAVDDVTPEAALLRKRVQHQCVVLANDHAGRYSPYEPGRAEWALDTHWHNIYAYWGQVLHRANPGICQHFTLS